MKLYRLEYSCYARKAQMVLDLLGLEYECIDVTFGDRSELAELTGGYIQVPVLVDGGGRVIVDSRAICAELVQRGPGTKLVPSPWEGPIWAYADWCDGPLEDVMALVRRSAGAQHPVADDHQGHRAHSAGLHYGHLVLFPHLYPRQPGVGISARSCRPACRHDPGTSRKGALFRVLRIAGS